MSPPYFLDRFSAPNILFFFPGLLRPVSSDSSSLSVSAFSIFPRSLIMSMPCLLPSPQCTRSSIPSLSMDSSPENSTNELRTCERDAILISTVGHQFEFLVKPAAGSSARQQKEAASNGVVCTRDVNGTVHDEEGEGFRTPTSTRRSAPPAIKQCPPAPRKPRPRAIRPRMEKIRRPSSRRLLLVSSDEVEALFPLTNRKNFCRKIESTPNKLS